MKTCQRFPGSCWMVEIGLHAPLLHAEGAMYQIRRQSQRLKTKHHQMSANQRKSRNQLQNANRGMGQRSQQQMQVRPRGKAPTTKRSVAPRSQPAAKGQSMGMGGPLYLPAPGGVRIRHSEPLSEVWSLQDAEVNTSFVVNPQTLSWLAGVSEHFQQFVIKKWDVRYVPRVGTNTSGSVSIAPYYLMDNPIPPPTATTPFLGGFLGSLPGMKQFASWASEKIGWIAAKASREIFVALGILNNTNKAALTQNNQYDEAQIPGYVLLNVSQSAVETRFGDLWVDYDVELLQPRQSNPTYLSALSTTAAATLSLNTAAPLMGNYQALRPVGSNDIQCLRPGYYTLVYAATGTSPVMASAFATVVDIYGRTMTASRLVATLDASANAFVAPANTSAYDIILAGSGSVIAVAYFRLAYGDIVSLANLNSGSISQLRFSMFAGAPASMFTI